MLRDAVKYGKLYVENLLKYQMSNLSTQVKEGHGQEAMKIIFEVQNTTRQLQSLCLHGKQVKDSIIMSYTPPLKKSMESFMLNVKSIMKENNLLHAINWQVAALKAKKVDGSVMEKEEEIEDSQASQD